MNRDYKDEDEDILGVGKSEEFDWEHCPARRMVKEVWQAF
jgi:hypothetical protein